ncbi:phosphatidylinositol-binding clathrin assembly protein-like [Dendronephthya gigantea]|uniref:phosphatidylinositol-binding clathrin assembly protein-like n=1 Tax=Dendronephthya gigantea TaxID=151771 RepID=UPI00106C030F|nr:phosphatidylinositol-binding clathrin assembly protein-like [Dendronephthya gigantea]
MSVADKIDVARMSFSGSNVAKAVCKATTREVMGPKKKHVDYLLQCTENELMNLAYMTENLMERCRMSSWVIVSKALVTFHSLMSNGNERFFQQLSARTALWDLENFLDKTAVIGYDMSSFIKRYSKYLIQKVNSYRQMNYDFCRAKRGADGLLRTLSTDKLLKALVEIQVHIDSLLEVDLQSSEFSNGVINSAFVLLFKDMIKLFACYNDGMINLLEKYYEMNKESCKESLEIYKKFIARTDQVSTFLTVAQDIGVSADAIPDLAKAPSSLLESLENHYKSLEKGQIPVPSETKHLNLAPITISLKSEQFNFQEDLAEQFSPEENNNEDIDGQQPTLLQSSQTTNPGGEGPWQNMFEPEVQRQQPPKAAEPSNKQDDLLELHAVFQAQQAPPANAFQQPGPNFGAPMASNLGSNYPPASTNPFDAHHALQSSGDILQPMNKPQPAPQVLEQQRHHHGRSTLVAIKGCQIFG